MNKRVLSLLIAAAFAAGCASGPAPAPKPAGPANPFVMLSSTIGPIDAGIVGTLEDAFEKETGIRVRHVGAGTGAALEIAKQGTVDLVMVHAKSLEEKFVLEGFGVARIPLMYNDFVIVGPGEDPAGIKGMASAPAAMKAIAEKGAPFVTRGDKSGTHIAELDLWAKAGVKPEGGWYAVFEKGAAGNAPTLKYVNEKNAYTVIDRATWLTLQKEMKIAILVEKDEALLNFISLVPVSKAKFPKVNAEAADAFVRWLTAPDKGQAIIRDFGKEKFGGPLFFPNSDEYKKAQK